MTHLQHLSPSFIKSFRMCPERERLARLRRLAGEPEILTDSAMYGTATHKAVEFYLKEVGSTWDDAVNVGEASYAEQRRQNDYWLHKANTKTTEADILAFYLDDAREYIRTELIGDDFDHTQGIELEQTIEFEFQGFKFKMIADFVDQINGYVLDWKTGRYDNFTMSKYQRHDPAATIYCYGLDVMIKRFVHLNGKRKDPGYKIFDITRPNPTQWMKALVEELKRWQDLTDNFNLDKPWPLKVDDWWCSEQWCMDYANCQGQFVSWKERAGK
jgi:PD-(D/E)XK nuclease superfamily